MQQKQTVRRCSLRSAPKIRGASRDDWLTEPFHAKHKKLSKIAFVRSNDALCFALDFRALLWPRACHCSSTRNSPLSAPPCVPVFRRLFPALPCIDLKLQTLSCALNMAAVIHPTEPEVVVVAAPTATQAAVPTAPAGATNATAVSTISSVRAHPEHPVEAAPVKMPKRKLPYNSSRRKNPDWEADEVIHLFLKAGATFSVCWWWPLHTACWGELCVPRHGHAAPSGGVWLVQSRVPLRASR